MLRRIFTIKLRLCRASFHGVRLHCPRMISGKQIGVAVRELRKAKGMSQASLAEAVGRSTDAISQIELGKSLPSLETLLSLAGALGVPAYALLPDDAPEEAKARRVDRVREVTALLFSLSERELDVAVDQIRALGRLRGN